MIKIFDGLDGSGKDTMIKESNLEAKTIHNWVKKDVIDYLRYTKIILKHIKYWNESDDLTYNRLFLSLVLYPLIYNSLFWKQDEELVIDIVKHWIRLIKLKCDYKLYILIVDTNTIKERLNNRVKRSFIDDLILNLNGNTINSLFNKALAILDECDIKYIKNY